MQVLHLMDAASPQACSTTLAMLGDALGRVEGVRQRVVLAGGRSLRGAAEAAGLRGFTMLPAPLGRAPAAYPGLRRRISGGRGDQSFDAVHCWSVGALVAACLAYRHTPKLLTLTTPPTHRATRLLRVLTGAAAGRVETLAISNTIRRRLLGRGVAPQRVHVLRPGIDMARIDAAARTTLRRGWGLEPASPPDEHPRNATVIAVLSDPPAAVNAVDATLIAMIVAFTRGRDTVRLLIHPDQRGGAAARRMARAQGMTDIHIHDPRIAQPWSVLPGCDLALALSHDGPAIVRGAAGRIIGSERPVTRRDALGAYGAGGSPEGGGGGLALLWAMAANLPIVGEATYGVSEIVEDRHSALLARPGQHRRLIHRIDQLLDDPHEHWRLRDTARHEAYSFFSRRRYCDNLSLVYRQLARQEEIAIPEMEVTGGLRFSGRA